MLNDYPNKQPAKLNEFFLERSVFTVDELDRFLLERGRSGNPNTRKSLLAHHCRQGRIISVRRGLYATVTWIDGRAVPVDPYLVAAKMTPDAVLSYHTAMEFHGNAYTVYWRFQYTSAVQSPQLWFQHWNFKRVPVHKPLIAKNKEMFGVTKHRRSGVEFRVASIERTLVDAMHRPDLVGDWEEIWRSFEYVDFFDSSQIVEYVLLLENATTAAKVGFFLERNRDNSPVSDSCLNLLRSLRPKKPHYMVPKKRGDCRLVRDWNLMVPVEILNKSWEEVL